MRTCWINFNNFPELLVFFPLFSFINYIHIVLFKQSVCITDVKPARDLFTKKKKCFFPEIHHQSCLWELADQNSTETCYFIHPQYLTSAKEHIKVIKFLLSINKFSILNTEDYMHESRFRILQQSKKIRNLQNEIFSHEDSQLGLNYMGYLVGSIYKVAQMINKISKIAAMNNFRSNSS